MHERLKALWAVYWDVRDTLPLVADALKAEISLVTTLFREQDAEIRKLEERNEETERLLKAAIRSSQRQREPR